VGDIACAFQEAAVETLVIKCERALQQTGQTRLVVAGGVGANQLLRSRLADLGRKLHAQVSYPRPAFCTDNGAMIAYAGCVRLRSGQGAGMGFGARARWNLADLTKPATMPSG
jgi:N6-L-threonylcarbamoyladenine synthase